MTRADLTLLSLGAGVQSTTLALLSAEGRLPRLDGAIFADTGNEPAAVYTHLDRLEHELAAAGIPLYRVSRGDLIADSLDPGHRFASIPYFILGPDGSCSHCHGTGLTAADPARRGAPGTHRCPACGGDTRNRGIGRRQCTGEYKLSPIRRMVRELLGAKAPAYRRVPPGRVAQQWIGFSADEIHRIHDGRGVSYLRTVYPLLDLVGAGGRSGWDRADCRRYLASRGFADTPRSACLVCPFRSNAGWRQLRDRHPAEFAAAVRYDAAIRRGGARGEPLRGEAYLHRSCVPLDQAPIDMVTAKERAGWQGDLFDVLEAGEEDGCSPYGCRSGTAITAPSVPGLADLGA